MKNVLLNFDMMPKLAIMRYPQTSDIVRRHQYNIEKMVQYGERTLPTMFNQNILVGILQHLAIDPAWSMDYVINYTRYRSRSLCSAFQIASQNNKGKQHNNTLFFNGCHEFYCLLEKEQYQKNPEFKDLQPLVPLYSDITTFGYKTAAGRERNPVMDYHNNYAVVGINFIELAVGWWYYLNDPLQVDRGIHHYVATLVMPQFEVLHNELSLINSVYQRIVNKTNYDELLLNDPVHFNTFAVRDRLLKFIEYWVITMKANNWHHPLALYGFLTTPLTPDTSLWLDGNRYTSRYYENTLWCLELPCIQYHLLYFTLLNELSISGSGLRSQLKQNIPLLQHRYHRIGDETFKEKALGLLDDLLKLVNDG